MQAPFQVSKAIKRCVLSGLGSVSRRHLLANVAATCKFLHPTILTADHTYVQSQKMTTITPKRNKAVIVDLGSQAGTASLFENAPKRNLDPAEGKNKSTDKAPTSRMTIPVDRISATRWHTIMIVDTISV